MGGGGKGSSTQTVELPKSLEIGAEEAIAAGLRSAALPYAPNRGITIAALDPMQTAAMSSANSAAGAFGLPIAQANIPAPQTASNGIQGYSTGALYDAMRTQSMPQDQQAMREALLNSYAAAAGRIIPNPAFGDVPSGGEVSKPKMSFEEFFKAQPYYSNGDNAHSRKQRTRAQREFNQLYG